jgi:hypothetical protein
VAANFLGVYADFREAVLQVSIANLNVHILGFMEAQDWPL